MSTHEPHTTNTRGLLFAGGLVALMLLISALSVGALIGVFNRANPGKSGDEKVAPVPARIQEWQNPRIARDEIERQARERISGYEWIDRRAGVVRIPVERAMQLMAQPEAAQENKR